MKNREERPTASDRGASQRTFDLGDEAESMLPANLLRQESTDPASIDMLVSERLIRDRFDGASC